jgi:hypothetical protein
MVRKSISETNVSSGEALITDRRDERMFWVHL